MFRNYNMQPNIGELCTYNYTLSNSNFEFDFNVYKFTYASETFSSLGPGAITNPSMGAYYPAEASTPDYGYFLGGSSFTVNSYVPTKDIHKFSFVNNSTIQITAQISANLIGSGSSVNSSEIYASLFSATTALSAIGLYNIQKIKISSDSTSLTVTMPYPKWSSSTNSVNAAYYPGGYIPSDTELKTIHKINFSSDGICVSAGSLSQNSATQMSSTEEYMYNFNRDLSLPNYTNFNDKFSYASEGNSISIQPFSSLQTVILDTAIQSKNNAYIEGGYTDNDGTPYTSDVRRFKYSSETDQAAIATLPGSNNVFSNTKFDN